MTADTNVAIRRACEADRAFVLSLAGRFAETRPAWRSEDEVTRGTVRALTRAFDAPRENEALFVAVDANARPLAFAYVIEDEDFFTGEPHAHVSEVAAVRGGTGAGAPLLAVVESWARARGSRYISLHVNATNERARELYEREGFALEYRRMAKLLR